ncbi:acyltransferase family protein [Sphingomonas sp. Tas61C01]|uniref:acyltransferase family protein n=1 Tax=Sphingomonas sp. Tas61C01 TaxID=3458297 RepID=UPI00403E469C
MSQRHETFDTLNGLRGVAAIAVTTMHLSNYFGVLRPAIVSIAVDFFFVLSGFVIAFAYERQMLEGLTAKRFILARVIRLYPLYLLGLILGALAMWTYQRPPTEANFFATLGFNLAMLPFVAFDPTNVDLFPLNFPAWSLFFELVANLGYALLMPRLTNIRLGMLVALGLLGLILSGLIAGTLDLGTLRPGFLGGLSRVTFSFFAGVGLYRLWLVRPTRWSLHPAILFALLVLPLLFNPQGEGGWLYQLAAVCIYMPCMVWLGAGSKVTGKWRSACVALGALSYPLYVIHAPVWTAVRAFNGWQGNNVLHDYAPWSGLSLTVLLCVVSWWLDRAVDYPVRRWLSGKLLGRTTQAANPEVNDTARA